MPISGKGNSSRGKAKGDRRKKQVSDKEEQKVVKILKDAGFKVYPSSDSENSGGKKATHGNTGRD